MSSINTEYLTNSFFSLLLLNDPESVEKNKDTDKIHYKVWYLMEFEKMYNLKRFDLILLDNDEKIKTDYEFFRKMNALFKTKLRQPRTYNEIINFYYLRLNNLIGKIGLLHRKIKKKGFEYSFDIEQYKNFIIYHDKKLNSRMKEEEEKQKKCGSPKNPDVITIEEDNILLHDDDILKYLIDEIREENKKRTTAEKPEAIATAPELVPNDENKKDDDTDTEDEKEADDPEIIDIFINGYETQIQIY